MAIKPSNTVAATPAAEATTKATEATATEQVKSEAVVDTKADPVAQDTETSNATVSDKAGAEVEQQAAEKEEPKAEVETAAQAAAREAAEAERLRREERAKASAEALEEEDDEPAPTQAEVKQAAQDAGSTSNQVATAQQQTGVAAQRTSVIDKNKAELEAEGFEGVDVDYSSFLNFTLNKQIESSEGHEMPNTGFLVRLAQSRAKYCFRNNNPVEDEVEVAYDYDPNAHKNPDSPVYAKIQEWREQGLDLGDIKKYLEVWGEMVDDCLPDDNEAKGTLIGRLISIQVAPTSQGRFGGYVQGLKMRRQGPADVITRVRRGKKVESGKFPFYPWEFIKAGNFVESIED